MWGELLDDIAADISASPPLEPESRALAVAATDDAAARAHARLLVALQDGTAEVRELVGDAAQLLIGVAELCRIAGQESAGRRAELIDQLEAALRTHEDAVLAGESTYLVRAEQSEQPAARIRQLLPRRTDDGRFAHGDLLSLRTAAGELAALLIRAAANQSVGGRAEEAPERRPPGLDAALRAITKELRARARRLPQPVSDRADVVAHHLAAGLRVRVSENTLERLTEARVDELQDWTFLAGAREAWLRLAANEYVAVKALDSMQETPAYAERFESLESAIRDGAVNVLCAGRLLGRAGEFRHRKAWGHQAISLSYALEAYVAGLRGDAASIAQAQLIALTRLVRAVAAIALLDLERANSAAGGNQSPERSTSRKRSA